MTHVAVIGAGAAGICSARHLLAGGHDVVVFEAGSHVGGLWVYENDSGRSPAYGSLHINSEARVTSYPDFPFPDGTPLYPSHEQIRSYLDAYADHFGVRPRIRFNTEVDSVERAGASWLVRSRGVEEEFDAVVVASGHQGAPAHPPFAQQFTGEYLHAHAYRQPEPFRGRRVLIIGVGNSALDIAADVCTVAASTAISARSPVLIMPRMAFGVPVARVLAKIERPWVPWAVSRRLRELLVWVTHGRMEGWGFVTPKTRIHPAGHPTLIHHMEWERVVARPGITAVEGPSVSFADGRVEDFEVMIAATGYEVDLPFLPPELSPVSGRRVALYKRLALPAAAGLYFVGFFNVSGGANIRMMDVQARWVAAAVEGAVRLPPQAEMLREIARDHDRIAKRYPSSPRYGLELEPRSYARDIEQSLAAAGRATTRG